ncbi:sensor histidine kinase [Nonomuraea turcica]|uniref:sensor histidine kinase n=1 Tax=Nonomuraea sp. G32 TaxID=3067274 RepID=UPI00273A909A|nr:histidine kinase [Nonomuraea sp. G32]MDP4511729.1 histidine kinase [Nonomuraea sp. G32]
MPPAPRAEMIRPPPADVLTAVALAALDLVVFSQLLAPWGPNFLPVAYAAPAYAALAWRRRWPVPVFAIMWVHGMVPLLTQLPPGYRPTLGLLLALLTVAAHRPARDAAMALAATLLPMGFAVAEEVRTAPAGLAEQALIVAGVILPLANVSTWGVGRWVSASRAKVAELDRRRAVDAEAAAAAERVRLARELHDIVAHAVTLMILQAAGGRRVLHNAPTRAEEALRQIEELGGQAVAELRRLLAVLRPGDDGEHGQARPGLDALDQLLTGVRATGAEVGFVVEGEQAPLDPSVSTTAYRIVQEGLTNTARHAPGTAVTVRLRWGRELSVEITNGPALHPPAGGGGLSTGHGLVGLAERVAVAGGRFETSPTDDGGFRLSAALPTADRQAQVETP